MSEQINLEEILKKELIPVVFAHSPEMTFNATIRAMKEACKQTLELAAENAEARGSSCGYGSYWVDRESILDTIKQIV